jgi:hypothetical protein
MPLGGVLAAEIAVLQKLHTQVDQVFKVGALAVLEWELSPAITILGQEVLVEIRHSALMVLEGRFNKTVVLGADALEAEAEVLVAY